MTSKKHWTKIAQTNPYHGVLTSQKYLGAALDSTTFEEFFKTGFDHYKFLSRNFDELLERRGLIVDFGCGVGRLLYGLSRLPHRKLIGVDVAPNMRALARQNLEKLDVDAKLLSKIEDIDEEIDVFHSCIVFQHIETELGYDIIEQAAKKIGSDGLFLVQLPIGSLRGKLRDTIHFFKRRIPALVMLHNILSGKSIFAPHMQMNVYKFSIIFKILTDNGFEKIYVKPYSETDLNCVYISAVKAKSAG